MSLKEMTMQKVRQRHFSSLEEEGEHCGTYRIFPQRTFDENLRFFTASCDPQISHTLRLSHISPEKGHKECFFFHEVM
jgi:hypothetical protein